MAEDDQIRVTVVDEHRSYLSAPDKAARETDYYRLEHPDVDPEELPPLLFETMLSRIEGNAKTVIDELLSHGDIGQVEPERAALFAWHLALTVTRGKAFRAEQQEMTTDLHRLQYARMTDEGIRTRLRQHGVDPTPAEVAKHRSFLDDLQSGQITVQQPDAAVIAMSAQLAETLGEHLLDRAWVVYETPPILVTCDEPVIVVGGPGSPRSERSGVGVAGVVIHPLSPSALLVLFHDDMRPVGPAVLDHIETAEINREVIASSSRWAFERPSRRVAERLRVPPLPAKPFMREGPFPQPDGNTSEIYRNFKPTRWQDHAPPWPVRRWWRGWVAQQSPRLASLPAGATISIRDDGGPQPRGRRHGPTADR